MVMEIYTEKLADEANVLCDNQQDFMESETSRTPVPPHTSCSHKGCKRLYE